MIKILLVIATSLFAHVVFGQLQIRVIGHVSGDTEGYDKVYVYNQLARDSAEIRNGRFEIEFVEPVVGTRAISLEYDRKKMRMFTPVVLFFDQSGVIEVRFDIEKGLSSATLTGMPSAVTYANYMAQRAKIFQQTHQVTMAKFGKESLRRGHEDFEEASQYRDAEISRLTDSLLDVFVDGNQYVAASLVLAQVSTLPLERLAYYYNRLSPHVQDSEDGLTLHAKIQGMKNAYIGAEVKTFELPDEQGIIRSFEEFRGKYILLDFWASWCSPCRASFPRMREVYSKIKNQNFIIVNISIDRSKEAWLKAVDEEKNPWPQLYDDRRVSSELFNVNAVPTAYLIDPQGTIMMKEIGFDPTGGGRMERKLEEIFNVKF